MAVTTAEARARIVGDLGAAAAQLSLATAALGEAYELLDDAAADRLEGDLFRPAQRALGRAKRTRSEFARRFGVSATEAESPSAGLPSQGVKSFVARAVTAVGEADRWIAELQDSMAPIEAGDAELRAGLADVRELIAPVPGAADAFLRTLGR